MTSAAHWKDLYREALLEVDPYALSRKLRAAKTAIQERSQELASEASAIEEKRVLADALRNLEALERHEIKSLGETA